MEYAHSYFRERWFDHLTPVQQQLIREAFILLQSAEKEQWEPLIDYSYIVFPAAKAYEGFLKTFLYKLDLISLEMVQDEHFRIGKALNPDLPVEYREKSWIYGKLALQYSEGLARFLWLTWKACRNQVFHYKVEQEGLLSLDGAALKLERIIEAIRRAALKLERRSN
jgi:hypothetical protein